MVKDLAGFETLDVDLIRTLRKNGHHDRVNELLREYHACLALVREQERDVEKRLALKQNRQALKDAGICVTCKKRALLPKRCVCELCLEKKKEYEKNWRRRTRR